MTADIIPLPKRKPVFPDYAGPTERPLYPGGIDDLWPSPDHWRSLDPPRDIKATGDRSDET